MLPTLPTEIWERIIDHNWGYPATLVNCSQVCRAWTARSCYHLLTSVVLVDRGRTWWLVELLRGDVQLRGAVNLVAVRGGRAHGEREPIPHFATFSSALAKRLPKVKTLQIFDADWRPASTHSSTLLHLSTFGTITSLRLARVTFPSKLVLARLICALQNLTELSCADLAFKSSALTPASLCTHTPRLKMIRLDGDCEGVADLIASQPGFAASVEELRFGFSWGVQASSQIPSGRTTMSLIRHAGASLKKLGIKTIWPSNGGFGSGAAGRWSSFLLPSTQLRSLAVHCYLSAPSGDERNLHDNYGAWLYDLLDGITSMDLMELGIWFMANHESENPPDGGRVLQRAVEFLDQQEIWKLDFLLGATRRFENLACVQMCLVCGGEVLKPPDSGGWDAATTARLPLLQAQGRLRWVDLQGLQL